VTGDESGPCAGCGRDPGPEHPVTWSGLFAGYLCASCLMSRTDAELGATRQANLVARRQAEGAA
jgi:hypothetical protein